MNDTVETAFDESARKTAHDILDRLFDHLQSVDSRPVVDWRSPDDLAALAGTAGSGDLRDDVDMLLRNSIQLHHRSYMGHQVCPPLPVAVLGDLVISALNQSAAVWEMSPFATAIENEVIRLLTARVSYPDSSRGTTVSGGTAANLTALLAARARWQRENPASATAPVIVCSKNAHYSISRAAAVMGMKASDVISIGTDERQRMDVDELAAALQGLEEEGRGVIAVVATAGSTSAGAFDDLPAISDLRDRYRTWLHVDAAHGASVLFSRSLRHLVGGLERSDSLSWDPHKMLWMPLSLGVVLLRDGRWLSEAFEVDAPYLFHRNVTSHNLGELTLQCSRRADAVKLWLALRNVGESEFEQRLDRVAATTQELYRLVAESADFEALHEPAFNIFCFRWKGDGTLDDESLDAINAEARQRLLQSGRAWITSTVIDGVRVLRVTIINPRTDRRDVAAMLDEVHAIALDLAAKRHVDEVK